MGGATSVELGNGVAEIQKILASTSPRSIEDPEWSELVNKKINSRFWTQVYLRNISAFDAAVQSQVTSPLLALNDSTGNLRTLLRFAARMLYHHRTNSHNPTTCKPEALIELILLMTHVIKGFQDKLSVQEFFFHLDQAPLSKQADDRLFLHYWGKTVSMELVPSVSGYTLIHHTSSSLVPDISTSHKFRRIDAPDIFSMEEAGIVLDSGIRDFVICPRSVAECGSVNFILQEVVDFLVSTSWGAVGSVVVGEEPPKSERNKRVPLLDMELHGVLLDFVLVMFRTPEIVHYVCEKDCEPLLTTLLNFLWLHSYTHRVLDGSLPGAEHSVDVSPQEYEQSLEIANLVRERATEACCVLLWNHPRMRELVAALKETKADGSSQPKATGPLHFGPLVAHIVSHVRSPFVVLLLYTLTHHCPTFRRHLQTETDPHAVLIPLLQTIWAYTGDGYEGSRATDVTLLSLVLFDLLGDAGFQTILHEDVQTTTLNLVGLPALTLPVGSVLVVTISRIARWNFQFFRDEFINELVSGLIGNLRVPMHWYAAEGIVSLLVSLGRKLSTKSATQPLAYTLCRPIVGFLRRCLAQRHRGNVGFALIRKGDPLRSVSAFAPDLFRPLLEELDRMDAALAQRDDYEFDEAIALLDAMPFGEPPKPSAWVYDEQDSSYFLNLCKHNIVVA